LLTKLIDANEKLKVFERNSLKLDLFEWNETFGLCSRFWECILRPVNPNQATESLATLLVDV